MPTESSVMYFIADEKLYTMLWTFWTLGNITRNKCTWTEITTLIPDVVGTKDFMTVNYVLDVCLQWIYVLSDPCYYIEKIIELDGNEGRAHTLSELSLLNQQAVVSSFKRLVKYWTCRKVCTQRYIAYYHEWTSKSSRVHLLISPMRQCTDLGKAVLAKNSLKLKLGRKCLVKNTL